MQNIDASQRYYAERKKPALPAPQNLHVKNVKWGKLCHGDGRQVSGYFWGLVGRRGGETLSFDAHLIRLTGQYT